MSYYIVKKKNVQEKIYLFSYRVGINILFFVNGIVAFYGI